MLQRRTLAIVAACAGSFLAFLDTTIVNVSFPSISASFPEADRSELSWILDAYFIVIAALLIPAGALADRYGRKRVFLGSVALFIAASLACAVAPSVEALVVGRVIQGAGAAVIATVSMALILPEFPPERRAAGVGIWGAAAALAAALGPPLGGVLTELADWRLIFLVNLPLGALVLVAGRRGLVESRDERVKRLPDPLGAGLVIAGLGLLALGIVEGEAWGRSSLRVIASLVAGVGMLGLLAWRCTWHERPMVDPALFRIPSFRAGNLGMLLFAVAFFATILGNILFLTSVWEYSALEAGFATVPGPLATAIVAGPAGKLADRFGHRAVIVPGALIYAVGLMGLRSTGADPDYLGTWLPAMVLTGVGIGLAFPNLGAAAVRDIPPSLFNRASAVSSAFRQFGAVLGTALLVAIVGQPESLEAALGASDIAYVFAAIAGLLAGAVALALKPLPAEPDRLLRVVDADEDDGGDIEGHGALGGLEVVPAASGLDRLS